MKRSLSRALALLLLVCSYPLYAISFNVIGPCSDKAIYSGSFEASLTDNVGKISIEIFEQGLIPYLGSEHGMNSINNTPTGTAAIEVISATKMRAYGWCFSVNQIIPDALSSEILFTNQNDLLNWFYAYSTYDQGVWTDYCVPAHTVKAPQFCK